MKTPDYIEFESIRHDEIIVAYAELNGVEFTEEEIDDLYNEYFWLEQVATDCRADQTHRFDVSNNRKNNLK